MRGASFFTRQSRVSASLKSYYRAGLKVPFSHGWPPAYCGTARRPGAVLSRESRSLVAPSGARARARRSQTTIRPRESSLASLGDSPRGPGPCAEATACLGAPDTEATGFRAIFVEVL